MVTRAPEKPVETAYALVETTGITQHPDNPRHDVGDVTDLAASIAEHGLLEPLVVIPTSDLPTDVKGTTKTRSALYVLIAGHRRLAAARHAKVKTVPVLVRHDLTTREAQVAAMVIENQHRADLSPLEEGEAYQLLLEITPKATQAQVAKTVGMPRQRVSARLRLTKLSDKARAKIHAGQVTLDDALAAASFADDPAVAAKVEAALGTPSFPHRLEEACRERKFAQTFAQWCKDLRASDATDVTDVAVLDHAYDAMDKLSAIPALRRRIGWIQYHEKPYQWERQHEAHKDCPHHAYEIDDEHRDITFWCLDPSVHDEAVQETDEERAQREAREAEIAKNRELEERRSVASAVRARHARRVLITEPGTVPLEDLLRRVPRQMMLTNGYVNVPFWGGPSWPAIAVFFDLDPDLPPPTGADNLRESAVAEALSGYTLPALAGAWWFLSRLEDEQSLTSWRAPQDNTGVVAAEYVRELTNVLGYQWSDFEREDLGLDEHGHRAPRIDPTVDEDEGGDDA